MDTESLTPDYLWQLQYQPDGWCQIVNVATDRMLFDSAKPISGPHGSEGGWLKTLEIVATDDNYYDRAKWTFEKIDPNSGKRPSETPPKVKDEPSPPKREPILKKEAPEEVKKEGKPEIEDEKEEWEEDEPEQEGGAADHGSRGAAVEDDRVSGRRGQRSRR